MCWPLFLLISFQNSKSLLFRQRTEYGIQFFQCAFVCNVHEYVKKNLSQSYHTPLCACVFVFYRSLDFHKISDSKCECFDSISQEIVSLLTLPKQSFRPYFRKRYQDYLVFFSLKDKGQIN